MRQDCDGLIDQSQTARARAPLAEEDAPDYCHRSRGYSHAVAGLVERGSHHRRHRPLVRTEPAMGVDQTGPPVAATGDRAVLYAVRGRPGPFDPDRQRVAQAAVSAEWGSAAVTLVSEAAHLAAFGSLWIVQYLLLDWILFASRRPRDRVQL
jgi:hypothetical protein